MAAAIETNRFHEFRVRKGAGGSIVVREWSCSECSGDFALYLPDRLPNCCWIPKTCPFCSRPFDEWKELA